MYPFKNSIKLTAVNQKTVSEKQMPMKQNALKEQTGILSKNC